MSNVERPPDSTEESVLLENRERVGNYVMLDLIGKGGMGAVYRAIHPEIRRTVAIKVLRADLAANEDATARFFDEARAVNAIRHEGIVDIFDLGRRADGSTYFVMEYLEGEDLDHLLKRESSLPADEAVPLVRQVAAALAAAHRRGIVHRDLKPQNLFIVPRGRERRVKLLDFGIAKLANEISERPSTSTGVVMGTIPYMSPEQARGEHVDARADIYSLGCILFELLTGQVPFPGNSAIVMLARLASEPPSPPSWRSHRFGVPPALDAIVVRALAKDPDERYSDIEELDAALAALDLSSLPPASPRAPVPAKKRASEQTGEAARTPTVSALGATIPDGAAPNAAHSDTVSGATTSGERATRSDRTTGKRTSQKPTRPDPLAAIVQAPISDSTRRLTDAPVPLIDPSAERRVINFVIPVLLVVVAMGFALYFAPFPVAVNHEVLGKSLPWLAGSIFALCGLLVVIARTQQSSQKRRLANRAMTLLSVTIITTSIYLKGAMTSYDVLYYPVLIILDRVRENRALARVTFVISTLAFAGIVLVSHLGILPYGPLYPGRVSPELIADRSLVIIVIFVMCGISYLSWMLVDLLAMRVHKRDQELREVGLGLAGRVQAQGELLRHSAELRSYLPPALADAILRGEVVRARKHQRRRLTVVRVDCPAIAGAVDETDPEEFADLVNQLCGRLGDLASEHGGMVDRFGGDGATVLFGALEDATEDAADTAVADHSANAVAFARAAAVAVAGLALACRAAGVEAPPVSRAVIHQGFASVGSFGSQSRLEFTAVGPMMSAAAQLLDSAQPGQIVITQPVEVALRGSVEATPRPDPVRLAGTRHLVRVYDVQ